MSADASKAAFEELKRPSAALVEFVANDTGIPPEVVFKVLWGLGRQVRLAAGQAAAAVLLNKPAGQVTTAEALAAVKDIAQRGDDDRRRRARRAALRETVVLLRPVAYPENLAGLIEESTKRLDDGLLAGMFTPAKRSPGRPGRSASDWDKHFMIEVVYTETIKNTSRDEAITLASGVEREDAAPIGRKRPKATMPRSAQHSQLRRMVADFEKALPKFANGTRKAAQDELRNKPEGDFVAFRKAYLAMDRARANQRGRGG